MSTAEEMKNVQNFLQQDMKAWSTSAQMFHEKAKQDIPQVAEGFQFYAWTLRLISNLHKNTNLDLFSNISYKADTDWQRQVIKNLF